MLQKLRNDFLVFLPKLYFNHEKNRQIRVEGHSMKWQAYMVRAVFVL